MTAAPDTQQQLIQRLGLRLSWHGAIAQSRMKKALGAAGLTPRGAMTLMHLGVNEEAFKPSVPGVSGVLGHPTIGRLFACLAGGFTAIGFVARYAHGRPG